MSGQTCLGVACSPRKNGNTEILLSTAMETLGLLGVDTDVARLADINYSPCQACEGCYRTGRCVIRDGAGQVFEKILSANILIMAAPVFSMGICAQAKMFIDRAQQFWATRYILKRPVVEDERFRETRRGIFISAAGTNLPGVFDGTLRVVRYFFKMMDVRLEGTYCYPGTDKKGEILSNTRALEEIREAARKLADPAGAGH
ncbi:MAG: flavodoxin family protein [Desulfocucumaceae bacterium]